METTRIREALRTALMLSAVSTSSHAVEIYEIGEVYIYQDHVAMLTPDGQWRKLTEDNLEERLDELIMEANRESEGIRERLQQMVFH